MNRMFDIVPAHHDNGIVEPYTLYTIYEHNDHGVFARFITRSRDAAVKRLEEFQGEG